jgi:hypothetical protein
MGDNGLGDEGEAETFKHAKQRTTQQIRGDAPVSLLPTGDAHATINQAMLLTCVEKQHVLCNQVAHMSLLLRHADENLREVQQQVNEVNRERDALHHDKQALTQEVSGLRQAMTRNTTALHTAQRVLLYVTAGGAAVALLLWAKDIRQLLLTSTAARACAIVTEDAGNNNAADQH